VKPQRGRPNARAWRIPRRDEVWLCVHRTVDGYANPAPRCGQSEWVEQSKSFDSTEGDGATRVRDRGYSKVAWNVTVPQVKSKRERGPALPMDGLSTPGFWLTDENGGLCRASFAHLFIPRAHQFTPAAPKRIMGAVRREEDL